MRGLGILLIIIAVMLVVGDDLMYWGMRIWRFQRRRAGRLQEWIDQRLLGRFRSKQRFQTDLITIRDFIMTLQLAMSLEDTLAGALTRAAQHLKDRGVFGERLVTQVRSRLTISPEAVIQGLAEDFDSDELREVMERLAMARDGGLSYADALAVSVDEIENRIRRKIEKDIQRAPLILTIPMVAGVFFSALILALYPIIAALIDSLKTAP